MVSKKRGPTLLKYVSLPFSCPLTVIVCVIAPPESGVTDEKLATRTPGRRSTRSKTRSAPFLHWPSQWSKSDPQLGCQVDDEFTGDTEAGLRLESLCQCLPRPFDVPFSLR